MKKPIQFIYTNSLAWYGARLAMSLLANYAVDYEIIPATVDKVVSAKGHDALLFSFLADRELYRIFKAFERANVPNFARDRGENDPIVVCGGFAMFQPEPIALLADVICVGDGEDFLMGFNRAMKASTRQARIDALAELPGAYIPSRRQIIYDETGFFVKDMLGEIDPVVPHVTDIWAPSPPFKGQVTQVEVARGCNKKCAFCSLTWRNEFRERPKDSAMDEIMGLGGTAAFMAPNPGGVSYFEDIYNKRTHGQNGEITVDDFLKMPYPEKGEYAKSSFTFGIEGITPKLRRITGKPIGYQKMSDFFERLFYGNALRLKLYFIRNVPGETEGSWEEWNEWYKEMKPQWRANGMHVHLQFTPLTKQAHTPFQWFAHNYNHYGEKFVIELMDGLKQEWTENKHVDGFTQIWISTSRLKATWLIDNMTNLLGRENGPKFLWAQHKGQMRNLRAMKYVGSGYEKVKRIAKSCGADVDLMMGDLPFDAVLPWSHIQPMGPDGVTRTRKFANSIKRRI